MRRMSEVTQILERGAQAVVARFRTATPAAVAMIPAALFYQSCQLPVVRMYAASSALVTECITTQDQRFAVRQ